MAAVPGMIPFAVDIRKNFCSLNNAGIISFALIAKPPALHLRRRRKQVQHPWSFKLDRAYLFISLISESMAAQFLTFKTQGLQTLDESYLFSSMLRTDRSEYFSQHWQRLSCSLWHGKKIFPILIHPGLTEFPNCVFKQQQHNLQLLDPVSFSSSMRFGFVLWYSFNRLLFEKNTPYILQKNK